MSSTPTSPSAESLEKILQWCEDSNKLVESAQIELFCEQFPDNPVVKTHLAEQSLATAKAVVAATRRMKRLIPMEDYFDMYGLSDGELLQRGVKFMNSEDEKVGFQAFQFLVKWKYSYKRSNAAALPQTEVDPEIRKRIMERLSKDTA